MTSTDVPAPSHAFVSTALPYVNAAPHLGFALELTQADVLARARRLAGQHVRFVSGTDEHSLKNVLAAERLGVAPATFVAEHAARFRTLADALDVSLDAFVRTSAAPTHRSLVQRAFSRLKARGDLYKQRYRGLFCGGCEQFFEPGELLDDHCPEHDQPLASVEEENWFFRLSRYSERLIDALTDLTVVPESARRESLTFVRAGLRDLSVSRDAARARGFGVPVPDDPSQVVYVWFDALFGYLTALGAERPDYWDEARARTHVIGKGITRFHAVYWIALLIALDEPLPTELFVHGYLTVGGQKISKSRQALDPFPLIARFGSDALRYYLLRHVRTTRDGDFDLERFAQAYTAELANQLGNLASRTSALIARLTPGQPAPLDLTVCRPEDVALLGAADALLPAVLAKIGRFELDEACESVFALVRDTNRYVDQTAPWALAKRGQTARLETVLAVLAAVLRRIAPALSPFLPRAAAAIAGGFADRVQIVPLAPLFPRPRPE